MKKQIVIKSVAIVAIISAIVLSIQQFFIPYNRQDVVQAYTYYAKEDFSEDILIAGASTTFVGISPLWLYQTTGLTSWNLGNSLQAPELTYMNIEEAFKKGMKPKLVIANARTLTSEWDVDANEPWLRRGLDYKPMSEGKFRVIKSITEKSKTQSFISYLLPILRYHSRWTRMTLDMDYAAAHKEERDVFHGQFSVFKVMELEDTREENMNNHEKVELPEESKEWFYKMNELCEKNGAKFMMVIMPNTEWTGGEHDAVQEFSDSLGANADFFDFNVDNRIDDAGLLLKEDFYDTHHVNARGSLKTTEFIGKYIVNELGITESQSTDELKTSLDDGMVEFQRRLNKWRYRVVDPSELEEKEKNN